MTGRAGPVGGRRRRSPALLRRAHGSVRLRVTLLAAGVFALTVLVAATVLLRVLEGVLVDDVRASDRAALEAQAAMLFTTGIPADVTGSGTASAVQLPLSGLQPVVMVMSDPTTLEGLPPGTAIPVRGPTGDVTFEKAVPSAGAQLLGITADPTKFSVATLDIGDGVLATASPLADVRDTLDATRALMWAIGPVLVALVAALAWVMVGRALRPVHAVTSRVAAIGSHSLHERVPVPAAADEVAELARTMNGMLGRLETATTTSRRLVSDASHELRTPVTVIRTELEVARRTPGSDWDAVSAGVLGELDRLQGLVDDLLLLARTDERGLAKEDVDVGDLAREAAARRRAVPVDVEAPDVVGVVGDPAALARALGHLVDNAARHAATAVRVVVDTSGRRVALHVDDDGPGIDEADRERVTERFVRLDEGRARDGGGAGLGLAVARDVAVAHGGALAITASPLGGARATLTLPTGP